jgi:hypothetical protein
VKPQAAGSVEEENVELRRRVRELEEERDILREAVRYFAGGDALVRHPLSTFGAGGYGDGGRLMSMRTVPLLALDARPATRRLPVYRGDVGDEPRWRPCLRRAGSRPVFTRVLLFRAVPVVLV